MIEKIALDYDDTIDQNYEFFSELTASLKAAGCEIHIVTDISESYREFRKNQLEENDITYDILVITGDKLKYCQDNKIRFIFDDTREYFKTKKAQPPAYLLLHTIDSPKE